MSTERHPKSYRSGVTYSSPRNGSVAAPNNSLVGPARTQGVDLNIPSPCLMYSPVSRASSFSDKRMHSSGETPSGGDYSNMSLGTPKSSKASSKKTLSEASVMLAKAKARSAQRVNDSMVYLDGPQIYTCAQCRTHLTSHDDIISKSFHGRHGRAYLFDQCVNISVGPAEDRVLITGLHSVCDIFCKRCKGMVGWTYAKAYELSQKYKEGKFIIEKINLHMEESDYYTVSHPAGERPDRWRLRSMSWGSDSMNSVQGVDIVYEYQQNSSCSSLGRFSYSPRTLEVQEGCTVSQRGADLDESQPLSPLPMTPDL